MIKISFSSLKKYEKIHCNNFKEEILNILPIFSSPYALNSPEDRNQFVENLLINPFKSSNLFLKEYFLTTQFIINSEYLSDNNVKNMDLIDQQPPNLLSNYLKTLSPTSIFRKIAAEQHHNNQDSKLKDTRDLLQQFISNRKDSKNSSSNTYQKLEHDLKTRIGKDYSAYTDVRDFFLKIKNKYQQKTFEANRIKLIEALEIQVCPYCNRQYIDVFKIKNKSKIAIAQLDHFYPKSNFPLYAISLYNLVPSCAKCNSLKSNKLSAYLYPYSQNADTENNQQYFQLHFSNYDQLRGVSSEGKSMIRLASKAPEILANAKALFHEALYQNHTDFAQRLLRAQRLDNPEYRKSINQYFKGYKLTESDLRKLLYGFNGSTKELLEKPLSKLAHDLINN